MKNGAVMKILHTADWHLGVRTDDLDRFEEQKNALRQIIDIANKNQVDMVLVAGDVYDSAIPSSEAEKVFYNTLVELSRGGDCAVVVIAGNHDDPKRLSNANIFSDKFNIYLVGYIDEIYISNVNSDRNIYAYECGTGYIKFRKRDGEEAVVACLPYPSYYRYHESPKEGVELRDRIAEWLSYGTSHFEDGKVNMILAHLTTVGDNLNPENMPSYKQVKSLIDANLPYEKYPSAQYVALGHIHQYLQVNKAGNMFYSGSLINQFFNEGDQPTSVIIADVNSDGVQDIKREFLDVKLLQRFTVESVEEAENVLKHLRDFLLKIEIRNVDYVDIEDVRRLRREYKNLVTLSIITKEGQKDYDIESKKDYTFGQVWDAFVAKKEIEKDDKVKELFLELMHEDIFNEDDK